MLLNYEWTVPEGYVAEHQVFSMPKQKDDLQLIPNIKLTKPCAAYYLCLGFDELSHHFS